MKQIVLMSVGLALLAAVLGCGCAHEQSAMDRSDTYPNSTNAAYVTGSYLPQDLKRNGPVTNGKNDVRIIDRSDIDRSGGANISQSLRQLGVTQ